MRMLIDFSSAAAAAVAKSTAAREGDSPAASRDYCRRQAVADPSAEGVGCSALAAAA